MIPIRVFLTGGVVSVGLCAPAAAQGPDTHSSIRLTAVTEGVWPGQLLYLGVVQSIAPGWHTYWDGLNDTGLPMEMSLVGPAGVTFGEPVWPAPVRHESEAGFLDHIYEREAVILVPMTVPATAVPGTEITIHLDASWLVCDQVCELEQGEAGLLLDVIEAGRPARASADSALITATIQSIPRPIAEAGHDVHVGISGDELAVTFRGAERLQFFPLSSCRTPVDLLADGETRADHLLVRFEAGNTRPVEGVLAVTDVAGRMMYYTIGYELPGLHPAAGRTEQDHTPGQGDTR